MKTLLFISTMLLAGQCFGQVYDDKAYFVDSMGNMVGLDTIIYLGFDTTDIGFYTCPNGSFTNSEKEATDAWTNYSIALMSLAILEYAEECYNDSTMYYKCCGYDGIVLYSSSSKCRDGIAILGEPCGTEYIHNKPTFTGFINWLERRQK